MSHMHGGHEQKAALQRGKQGIFRIVFGRTGVVVSLLLAQFLFLFAIFQTLEQYVPYFWVTNTILAVGIVEELIVKDENPTVKITWVVLVMALPVFGLFLYLFTQKEAGHRIRNRQVAAIIAESRVYVPDCSELMEQLRQNEPELYPVAYYLKENQDFPVFAHTRVKYFPLGEDKFEEMLIQLEKAERFIFMEYFILKESYMWDRILEILTRKVREGVEVRFLYDGTCSLHLVPYGYPKQLEAMGIRAKVYAPIRPFISTHYNNRDHRKILVVDGRVAFTGGVNLADEYINRIEVYGHWKDTAVMLEGEAVRSFTLMFLQMWNVGAPKEDYAPYLQGGQKMDAPGYVIPYGDTPTDRERVGEMVYMDIINRAERYVHIMTPYLIPDYEMMTALKFAAKRGVEVILILPHIPDKETAFAQAHSYYPPLLDAGVKIYEYTPGFVHAKVFVSDDRKAVVGTINLDYRSLYHHFECAAYLYKVPQVAEIEADFEQTLAKCQPMSKEDLRRDPILRQLSGRLLKVLAPLM